MTWSFLKCSFLSPLITMTEIFIMPADTTASDQFKETVLFPSCHQMSQWNSSHSYSIWRRHVRCRSHDLSSLPHHLLVSTYVSPVGAITVVHGPDAPAWLHKTKRHPSSPVCCGVTVASMSQSWRDWGLVPLPAARKRQEKTENIRGG